MSSFFFSQRVVANGFFVEIKRRSYIVEIKAWTTLDSRTRFLVLSADVGGHHTNPGWSRIFHESLAKHCLTWSRTEVKSDLWMDTDWMLFPEERDYH